MAESCQYAGMKGKRPKNKELVSICLKGGNSKKEMKDYKKCVAKAKADYASSIFSRNGKVITVEKSDFTMADCEELCTKNWLCDSKGDCAKIDLLHGGCRGFVVRDPYESSVQSKPYCWLIPQDAKMSGSYPDELKFDRLTMHEYGKQTPKKAFIKEQCDCGNRYIHVERDPLRTRLEHMRIKLKNAKGKEGTLSEEDKVQLANLEQEKNSLEENLKDFKDIAALGGVYDYLPLYIPHRIEKGNAAYIPHSILKATSSTASRITGQDKQFSYYWEGPVRITNIYKKLDFSTILYKCLDKSSKEEAWYISRREALMAEAKNILEQGGMELGEDESLPSLDTKDIGMLLQIFFRMRCFGHKIGEDGTIYQRDSPLKTPYKINTDFLGFEKGDYGPADNKGCFKNSLKASKKEEELVVQDILKSDLEGVGVPAEPMTLLDNGICEKLLLGEDNTLISKLNTAEKVLAWSGTLETAVNAGKWASNAASAVSRWWRGGTTSTTTVATKVADVDTGKLIKRTKELVEAMKQIVIRISGIEGAEDEQLKAFCAKEMLELVQNAGGIWPKISQNLAVRPDIIKDDYARNKLKETQSGNKDKGKEATMEYIDSLNVQVNFGDRAVPLKDFMTYERFLSAGSVGQVDMWKLRTDGYGARLGKDFADNVIPKDWAGARDTFIVKTVFKDTEDTYTEDWQLMKMFFEKLGKYMPPKIGSIWGVLKNLEGSIFDEFDLGKEAQFTQRGREMLKVFTAQNKEAADPTSGKGPVTVTTPIGLETDSKYVMIQTIAPGKPLSDYLEAVKGQWDRLAEWRTDIYSTILNVFGYTAVQNGFFQADPHPGNWFWDSKNRALTLIDWGGVEDWTDKFTLEEAGISQEQRDKLKQAHCTLARLYSSIGHMTPDWEACDSVNFKGIPEIDGTYNRHGVSIHQASEGEDELLLGHTYAYTYKHTEKPYTLWYDGEKWVVSKVDLFHPEVTINKAQMVSKREGAVYGQSFFGLAVGRDPMDLDTSDKFHMTWTTLDEDGKPEKKGERIISVHSGRTAKCRKIADRTQAYQMAAQKLGIKLKSDCEKLMYLDLRNSPERTTNPILDTEKGLLKRLTTHMNTDEIAFVCIHQDDSKELKARVGVPPHSHDIRLMVDSIKGEKTFIKVELPVVKEVKKKSDANDAALPADAADATTVAETETVELELVADLSDSAIALSQNAYRALRPVIDESARLSKDGVGSKIDWENTPLEGVSKKTQDLAYDQAQRAYAIAASLFDSDVAELAIMALQGRQSLSMFQPGEVPEVYTLFARCAIVFHGMVMDVLRENFMRLVPVEKLQWLLAPHDDRFYKVWVKYADKYLKEAGDTCADDGWSAIEKGK